MVTVTMPAASYMRLRGCHVVFVLVCLIFGTSYAVVSCALGRVDGKALNVFRMLFAAMSAGLVLLGKMLFDARYREALKAKRLPVMKMIMAGFLNQGFPHSLITIAQRSLSSIEVTIAQPCIPLFCLLAERFWMPEEKCRLSKVIPSVIALIGTVITFSPSFESARTGGFLIDYLYLSLAIASFGFGIVFVKAHLSTVDSSVLCFVQMLTSAIYATFLTIFEKKSLFLSFIAANFTTEMLKWAAILGFVFSFMSSLLFTFVVQEMGAMKAGYTNFGQIIVGVWTGFTFLHEWDKFSAGQVLVGVLGLAILCVSLVIGFSAERKISRQKLLLT